MSTSARAMGPANNKASAASNAGIWASSDRLCGDGAGRAACRSAAVGAVFPGEGRQRRARWLRPTRSGWNETGCPWGPPEWLISTVCTLSTKKSAARVDGTKRCFELQKLDVQRRRRRCCSLRLYFSTGVSWWRRRFRSAKIPALDTWRLKRRRADSIPSFSPTVTWVIRTGFAFARLNAQSYQSPSPSSPSRRIGRLSLCT